MAHQKKTHVSDRTAASEAKSGDEEVQDLSDRIRRKRAGEYTEGRWDG